MNDDLLKEVVEIDDITIKKYDNGQQAKVKANNRTYTVYEKKQDGSTSAAWAALERLGPGSVAQFSYVEKPGEFQGKPYTSRIVRIISEDIGNGMKNALATKPQWTNGAPSATKESVAKDDRFWERQAYEKCCSLWAASLLQREGWTQDDVLPYIQSGIFYDLFQAIKADGNKRFFKFSATTSPVAKLGTTIATPGHSEPLPVIDVNDDVDVEGIPF